MAYRPSRDDSPRPSDSSLGPLQSAAGLLRVSSHQLPQLPAVPAAAAPDPHAGADPAALAVLTAAVEALAVTPAAEQQQLLGEVQEDWEKPFMIEAAEAEAFRQLLPHDMPWRPGVLAAAMHSAQVGVCLYGGRRCVGVQGGLLWHCCIQCAWSFRHKLPLDVLCGTHRSWPLHALQP